MSGTRFYGRVNEPGYDSLGEPLHLLNNPLYTTPVGCARIFKKTFKLLRKIGPLGGGLLWMGRERESSGCTALEKKNSERMEGGRRSEKERGGAATYLPTYLPRSFLPCLTNCASCLEHFSLSPSAQLASFSLWGINFLFSVSHVVEHAHLVSYALHEANRVACARLFMTRPGCEIVRTLRVSKSTSERS